MNKRCLFFNCMFFVSLSLYGQTSGLPSPVGLYDPAGLAASLFAQTVQTVNGIAPTSGNVQTAPTAGMVKSNGTVFQAAIAGTDYLAPTGGVYLPQAAFPTVTPTANVNILGYTSNLAQWNKNSITLTGGQTDELGGTTASKIVGLSTGGSNEHSVQWPITNYIPVNSTVNFAETVYLKAAGQTFAGVFQYEFFVNMAVSALSYINLSTCAVSSTYTGLTITTGTVTNGFCPVTITGTLAAGFTLQTISFEGTTASGTRYYTGDGTNGIIVSHPQVSFTTSAQTYQDVTGTHRYCVAAYNAANVSSGCSPWADSASEVNSIVTYAVTGASYCKVFRSGGSTQGALIVSGSTQVTCGSTVSDNLLAADSTVAPSVNATQLLLANLASVPQNVSGADTRSTRYQITEYALLGGQGTYNLMLGEPGSQGTITSIHVSMSNPDTSALQLQVQCLGQSLQTVDFGTFFMLQDHPVGFQGNRIGNTISGVSSNVVSVFRDTEIPFTNGCRVDLYNNSTTPYTLYIDVSYKIGSYYSSSQRRVWHSNLLPTATAASLAVVPLLPTVTSTGGGELESVTLWVNPYSQTLGYLEGNPVVSLDGAASITANGTEDFFGTGFYGNGISQQSDKWGFWVGAGLTGPNLSGSGGNLSPQRNEDVLAYRFFGNTPADSAIFNNSVSVNWPNGQLGESNSVNVYYKSLVTYWTAQ